MDINIKAQKGMKTFVLVVVSGVGVFLTVSAAQYGYKVWTRAQEPAEGPLAPTEVTDESVTPTPTPITAETEPESLFEPLVEGEEPLGILNYSEFVDAYGTDDPAYDFNEDGLVDDDDFEIFKRRYQQLNQ